MKLFKKLFSKKQHSSSSLSPIQNVYLFSPTQRIIFSKVQEIRREEEHRNQFMLFLNLVEEIVLHHQYILDMETLHFFNVVHQYPLVMEKSFDEILTWLLYKVNIQG